MLALGCDHGGYGLMQEVKAHLDKRGIEYRDFGTYSAESTDYPIYAKKVCTAITEGECEFGILICGTGIGMSMTANKFKGIRAAVCSDCFSAQATRSHNNANVLCMGARVTCQETAFEIVEKWLNTEFRGGANKTKSDRIENIWT